MAQRSWCRSVATAFLLVFVLALCLDCYWRTWRSPYHPTLHAQINHVNLTIAPDRRLETVEASCSKLCRLEKVDLEAISLAEHLSLVEACVDQHTEFARMLANETTSTTALIFTHLALLQIDGIVNVSRLLERVGVAQDDFNLDDVDDAGDPSPFASRVHRATMQAGLKRFRLAHSSPWKKRVCTLAEEWDRKHTCKTKCIKQNNNCTVCHRNRCDCTSWCGKGCSYRGLCDEDPSLNHSDTRLVFYHMTHTAGTTLVGRVKVHTPYAYPVSNNGGAHLHAQARNSAAQNRQLYRSSPYDFMSHEGSMPPSFPFPREPSKIGEVTDTDILFMTSIRHPLGLVIKYNWSSFQIQNFLGANNKDGRVTMNLTRQQLEEAKRRLGWFTAILPVEELHETIKMMCSQFLWPSEACALQTVHTRRHNHSGYVERLGPAKAKSAILDNLMDTVFYFYGKELSRRQMQVWHIASPPRKLFY